MGKVGCNVGQLMNVGEIVDVASVVVHIIGPELRFAVGRGQLHNLAWILIHRMVSLNFKCNAAWFLLLKKESN